MSYSGSDKCLTTDQLNIIRLVGYMSYDGSDKCRTTDWIHVSQRNGLDKCLTTDGMNVSRRVGLVVRRQSFDSWMYTVDGKNEPITVKNVL